MTLAILTLAIAQEQDVVIARQRSRQTAALFGFDTQNQVRIATAVSEIARNAFDYAGAGRVEFGIEDRGSTQSMVIRISDRGPGIPNLDRILDGRYESRTGMGLGILGARRLMDQCNIESTPERGTTVVLKKVIPRKTPLIDQATLRRIADQLTVERPRSPLEDVQQQNHELLRLLDELQKRQDELARVNHELEDTNRGVVALYAELDEKASDLRRADEAKSTFLSNVSHEFRTPLNSILALSHILLSHTDGDLTAEQEKQVLFIRKGAAWLLEMVDDLLDLAKIEAGKIDVHPDAFTVENLFSTLRGVFRPLLGDRDLALVFEEGSRIPELHTDEAKVSQILRNFVSNALKFTEHGEVRVRADLSSGGDCVVFSVTDTGVGIARENLSRIFDEYAQVDNPLQRRVKGTGLGLSLCRKLAILLCGNVSVASELGVGSTFTATIPVHYEDAQNAAKKGSAPGADDSGAQAACEMGVLIIDDDEASRYLIRKSLSGADFKIYEAAGGTEGLRLAQDSRPGLILLDLNMPAPGGFEVLTRLRSDPATNRIPVIVVTSQTLTEDERRRLGADVTAILRKDNLTRVEIAKAIDQAVRPAG